MIKYFLLFNIYLIIQVIIKFFLFKLGTLIYINNIIIYISIQYLLLIVFLLLAVAYFTLLERKIMAIAQRRRGPNVIGFAGLLQPLADGLKLFLKETIIPLYANKFIFILSPILTFVLSLLSWIIIPFNYNNLSIFVFDFSSLFYIAISSLSIYGIILSGWSSNSKYAFLGGLRSTAQMISYEISLSTILLTIFCCSQSFNLITIIIQQQYVWLLIPLFPCFIIFFISILAETNRAPFDLPEAEAELVSGYNVEYSAMTFVLFFLAEYSNILLSSTIITIFFLGGWYINPFNIILLI